MCLRLVIALHSLGPKGRAGGSAKYWILGAGSHGEKAGDASWAPQRRDAARPQQRRREQPEEPMACLPALSSLLWSQHKPGQRQRSREQLAWSIQEEKGGGKIWKNKQKLSMFLCTRPCPGHRVPN